MGRGQREVNRSHPRRMDGAEVERVEVCRQKVENNVKIKEYGGCFGYTKQPFFDGYPNIYLVPTELTEHTEAYGHKLLESTEWPTLREARIHRNEWCI